MKKFEIGQVFNFTALHDYDDDFSEYEFKIISRTVKTITVRYNSINQMEQKFMIKQGVKGDEKIVISNVVKKDLYSNRVILA